jgi:CubicO group peptidase (beta-lactamase class C family)
MSLPITRRKFVAVNTQAASLLLASRFANIDSPREQRSDAEETVFAKLDTFVEAYMREMNAPGMTLVLADRSGIQRETAYGFADVEGHVNMSSRQQFEIGSIGKSFTAISLLQLVDEGKLDLHKPILEYLPWFRMTSSFSPITTHHLLTHSSGLPGIPPVFASDPAHQHRPAYPPGEHFYYCNMGYELLGHLLWTLGGREIGDAYRHRILDPLGMDETDPLATLETRGKISKSYYPFQNDRPYPRDGRLGQAPAAIDTLGSGSVVSTARDMGSYIRMIANRGEGPRNKLLSDGSFALFAKPYIRYWNPEPDSGYGYGIEVSRVEGHTVLSHTGGTNSFASAMHIDMDDGVGAFASINAMQGYRPEPVTQYAVALMRAHHAKQRLPRMPAPDAPGKIQDAADYAGTYQHRDGRTIKISANGESLSLLHKGKSVPLETLASLGTLVEAPDIAFFARHPDFARFALTFGRADPADPKSEIVEADWGGDWYTNSRYQGPRDFEHPKEWDAYVGHYRNENPALGSIHVVLRKGKLMLDGVVPLQPEQGGLFLLRDDEHSTEWIRFADIVNGKAMRLKISGEDMWRVMTD